MKEVFLMDIRRKRENPIIKMKERNEHNMGKVKKQT